jgi:hypothetical protein
MHPFSPKNLLISILTICLLCFAQISFAQTEAEVNPLQTVEVKFVNKSMLPKKYAIIVYQPSTPGNGAYISTFAPGLSKKYDLEVGTKVYIANDEQVEYVMSGQQLTSRTDKPFCIVTKEAKQIYTLPKN